MRYQLELFFTALGFFTRLPIPTWVPWSPERLNHAARYLPLVGWVVGATGALSYLGLTLVLPPALAVVLSMAVTIRITGAFHEDGFADTCDGLGGGGDKAQVLAIMKDSRIGSYGAVTLVLVVGLKIALTALLAERGAALAAIAVLYAHVLSRAAPLDVMWGLPYIGDADGSKSKPLAESITRESIWTGLAWALPALGLMWWALGLWQIAVAIVPWMIALGQMRRLLLRRLEGFTGDTLGATQQLCELALLLGVALVVPR